MAIECQCFCGARYTVPDEHAGKRGQCPKCGNLIMIPVGRSEDAELIELADVHEPTAEARTASARQERRARLDSMRKAPPGMSAPPPVVIETGSGFWRDAGKAFILFGSFANLFTFLFVCFINVVQAFISIFPLMWLVGLLIYGYVCSFYMKTVSHAAAGEEGLPSFGVSSGWYDEVLIPMLQWLGCSLFVLAPAGIVGIVMSAYSTPTNITLAVCGIIGATGMFFWPIFILTVALGGFTMLFRCDRCVAAVLRSPGPYMLICVLLVVAVAPVLAARVYIYFHGAAPLADMLGIGAFTLRALVVGLETYGVLVCTRLIGLYYHHFKEDFPWALG